MNIGNSIKSIRSEKELKQIELAEKSGISRSYLSEIESSKKTPDLNTLEKICIALNVPIHVFMFKAINEENITDPSKKRLVRELNPLIDKITSKLYPDDK